MTYRRRIIRSNKNLQNDVEYVFQISLKLKINHYCKYATYSTSFFTICFYSIYYISMISSIICINIDLKLACEKTVLIIEIIELINTTKEIKHLIYFIFLFKLMQSSILDL